jgi:leader peptidase (prepilin peptidase)/N-methyltransferase
VTWVVALGACAVGIALGPLLDRLARWSLHDTGEATGPGGSAKPPLSGRSAPSWRSRPWGTGLIAGAFAAAATLAVPSPTLLPAWWALALVAAPITRTDLARHRIPDILNILAFAGGALLLLIPVALADTSGPAGASGLGDYGRAWLGALAVSAALLALALIGPSGLGMGDVKLGPALGLYLGFLSWNAVLVGIAAGFVLAAVVGLALVARDAIARRAVSGALRRALPFGPFLLVGTLVGLVA